MNLHHPESVVIHAGDEHNRTQAVAPPIFQSATFISDTAAEFAARATGREAGSFYTRYGNPTHDNAARVVAELEGAEDCLLFASGVGAMSTTALALLSAGDHVVAQQVTYTGTAGLLRELLARFGVETTFVDQRSPDAFRAALTDRTKLILVETPSNPLLHLTDLAAVAAIGRERGIITLCDNTIATPLNQQPLRLGFDLVLHSATKALAGHADVSAGVVAGRRALMDRLWSASLVLGSTLGPIDAWLLLRGLRTLPLRAQRMDANALAVAHWLEGHPRVRAVHYPGLPSHPQFDLARRQMKGFGCLLSFELDAEPAEVEPFLLALDYVKHAPSLGSVQSLAMAPGVVFGLHASPEELQRAGIVPTLIRLSVGIEHPDDIIADLERAMGVALAERA